MEHLPALVIAVPLATAAFLMGTAPVLSRRAADLIAITAALGVLIFCIGLSLGLTKSFEVYWFGGWFPLSSRAGPAAIGICFVVDRFAIALVGIICALTLAALVFSWHYFDSVGRLFHTLMLVFLGSMAGFCLSGDLFTLFVFFELMSVTAFGLTGYKIEKSSLEGALNFAVTNSLGAFLILTGIVFLYGKTGALNLAQLGEAVSLLDDRGLVISSLILISAGFLVKGAIVPFHFWLPDAHSVAPTPVSVLFSGIMVELGLYGVLRVYWTVFDGALEACVPALRGMFLSAAVATTILAGIMCFMQRHLKRLLAFSSISHMGVMLSGVALLTPEALAGMLIYLTGHAFAKGGLFICTGILLHTQSSVDELELRGKGKGLRITGLLFLLGGLALAGIPFSGLFEGKTLLEDASYRSGHPWLPFLFLFSSMLTGGAVLRATGRIFLGWGKIKKGIESESPSVKERPETKGPHRRSPGVLVGPALALVLLAFLAAAFPCLSERSFRAATDLQDRTSYVEAVLGKESNQGRSSNDAAVPRSQPDKRQAALFGLASLCGALGLAGISLFQHRLSGPTRRTLDFFISPFRFLFAFQSGLIGDYVIWLVFGTSALAALFLIFSHIT